MAPKKTIWPIDPHTKGKHEVLRHYLAAWFPILGSFAGRVAFVDGFAGPGEYEGGEPGSPLIAFDAFRKHAANLKGEAVFLFIEEKPDRAQHLRRLVESQPKPNNCKIEVATADFEEKMTAVLDEIPAGSKLAPAFLMLDPFGVSGIPMSLIHRILKSGKAELYISFMYEFIDRFKSTPEFQKVLTDLYGTEDWRKGLALEGDTKRDFFLDLYTDQLRKSGAKHVLRFDLYRRGHLIYSLFFTTKSWKGADVMKRAIWKVDPFGGFAFHGTQYGQKALGLNPDYTALRQALLKQFKGKGWVTIEEVEEFVGSDQTDFHIGQLKRPVLVPLEKDGLLEADAKSRKRPRTYPPRTRLRFP